MEVGGAMGHLEPKPRINAVCALLLVAAMLAIVWLTPLGSPSEAISQVTTPPPPPRPAPPTPTGTPATAPTTSVRQAAAVPDAAAFPVPAGWAQADLSKQTAEM